MDFVENEHKILKFWESKKIFEKLREKNKKGKPWSFLDGPITANNPMGVHHAWGRTYKDMFRRYKAMQGHSLTFQNGFDCQGLHVEVEVEKELGFKNKKDIEGYGIEKFVNKCKERVHKYSKMQTTQSIRLGMFCDWGDWQTDFDEKGQWIEKSHSYYTLSDENNYAIWSFLKKCQEQGLLYKGLDVVPWCFRCGTAISQHEILTEEYKEITHQAVYVRLRLLRQDAYFLAWTTTPWTLLGNVALAVNPDCDYVIVNSKSEYRNPKQIQNSNVQNSKQEKYILLKEKVDEIFGKAGYEIEKEIKGKELEGVEYEGIFDELAATKNALGDYKHKVILWKDITKEDGTGIVHMAPGCGQEDYKLSKELAFPAINLTDNESHYREGFGQLSGKFVGSKETREWIFDNLKEKGLLFKIEDYTHRYPTCWRCKNELIFRLVDEWYISMEKLRKPLMEQVKKINWMPGFCLDRELDWLKNMQDWLISKKRYWGLALPIFECQCGHFEVIGSKEELKEKAVEGWPEFDGHSPHRPWLDKIKIKCSRCGALTSRILDVGNPWLDAGIVPFSTISDDNRSEKIPYFQNTKEGRQEWQKWFPVDLVCESFPGQFKNWFYVLLVMSQVLENKPPFKNLLGYASVVDEKGEEMHKSKGNAIWFDEGVEKIGADVMRWMYLKQGPESNMRFGYNIAQETARKLLTLVNCYTFFETYKDKSKVKSQKSKLQVKSPNLLDKWVVSKLNGLIKEATEYLDSFQPDKASWAIEDFFINDLSLWYIRRSRKRFEEASDTLYYVLLNLLKLLAPMMPFLAEELYSKLRNNEMPESIHLCDWPEYGEKMIDEPLEQAMAQVREIVALALAKRAELAIGVRQPIASLKLKIQNSKFKTITKNLKLLELIQEEVNVKEVIFDENMENDLEIDATLTEELREEGQVREIIRQVQSLRKQTNLTPQDGAIIYYAGDKDLVELLLKNQKEILQATRSSELKAIAPGQAVANTKELKIAEQILTLSIALKRHSEPAGEESRH